MAETYCCIECGSEREKTDGYRRHFCGPQCAKISAKKRMRHYWHNVGKLDREPLGLRRFVCEWCAKEFEGEHKKKYCSVKCRDERRRRLVLGRKPAPKKPECTCRNCGKAYIPKVSDRKTYCSRTCYFEDKRAKPKLVMNPLLLSNCIQCGKQIVSVRRIRSICSEECHKKQESVRAHEKAKSKKDVSERPCKGCGTPFTPVYGVKRRMFCTPACALKHHRKDRRIKYGKTHRHRARKYGVRYELVNRTAVFERDGWRCQICGKDTPKNKRGSRYPNAPELDHRIPLSRGGTHTYDNVQCACRSCNSLKGASLHIGQLPLFNQLSIESKG
jgi:hypothetical protein